MNEIATFFQMRIYEFSIWKKIKVKIAPRCISGPADSFQFHHFGFEGDRKNGRSGGGGETEEFERGRLTFLDFRTKTGGITTGRRRVRNKIFFFLLSTFCCGAARE